MVLIFYATSWLVKWLKKTFFIEKIKAKIPEWLKFSFDQERSQKKIDCLDFKKKKTDCNFTCLHSLQQSFRNCNYHCDENAEDKVWIFNSLDCHGF